MIFIELHVAGEPRLYNLDSIAQIKPYNMESIVTLNGQAIGNIVDECYDNIREMIASRIQIREVDL